MGQAFDRDGNVLGEAFGATKQEVLEQLMKEHPEAEEIRIKTFRDKVEALKQASTSTDDVVPTDRE